MKITTEYLNGCIFFFIIFFSYLQQRIIEGKPPIYISALFKPVLAWVFSRYFGSLTHHKNMKTLLTTINQLLAEYHVTKP